MPTICAGTEVWGGTRGQAGGGERGAGGIGAAGRRRLRARLRVPRAERLEGAAEDHHHLLVHRRPAAVLRGDALGPLLLGEAEAELQRVRARDEREEGALLELVREHRGVRGAVGPDGEAGVGVADGHREGELGAALRHGGDADAPGEELVGDAEEAVARLGDGGGEGAPLGDVAVDVEERLARRADVIEPELGVVDAVAAHLVAHVLDADPLARLHVLPPDAHEEAVDAVVGAADERLREHNRLREGKGGGRGDSGREYHQALLFSLSHTLDALPADGGDEGERVPRGSVARTHWAWVAPLVIQNLCPSRAARGGTRGQQGRRDPRGAEERGPPQSCKRPGEQLMAGRVCALTFARGSSACG